MKNFACIFVLFLFVSCKPLMLKVYNIKKPAVENKASILKAAIQYGLDTVEIYTVPPENFLIALNARPLPDMLIFDSDGAYIEHRITDTYCNSGLSDFISAMHPEKSYRKTEKTTLQEEWKKLRDIDGHALPSNIEKADFYLLIFWSVWLGKLNKDQVKVWEQVALQNKKCNIKVLKVNLDIQEA